MAYDISFFQANILGIAQKVPQLLKEAPLKNDNELNINDQELVNYMLEEKDTL